LDTWQCDHCGFTNDRHNYQCRSCGRAKPVAGGEAAGDAGSELFSDDDQHVQPAPAEAGGGGAGTRRLPVASKAWESAPEGLSCQVCGRRPARQVSYRGAKGMVFVRQTFGFDGPLCRTCAQSTYRNIQSRNLSWGWFGVISFFSTIAYAVENTRTYREARRELPEPIPSPSVDEAKLLVRPVWQTLLMRLPIILVILCVIGLAVWGINRDSGDHTPTFLDDYVAQFTVAFDLRNDVIQTGNERLAAYNAGFHRPIQAGDLVVAELEHLEAQIGIVPVPPSDPLRSLDSAWRTSVSQVLAAETALGASDTDQNRSADAAAFTKEDQALKALTDYLRSQN
jgi:hypothetical protein